MSTRNEDVQPVDPDFAALCDAYCDDRLTSETAVELERRVITDPNATAYFVRHLHLQAIIERNAGNLQKQSVSELIPCSTSTRPWKSAAGAVVMIAATMLVAATAWFMRPISQTPVPETAKLKPMPVAMVTDIDNAVFANRTGPLMLGNELTTGPVTLVSGRAQIMLMSGAVVDLVGPCDLKILNQNSAELHQGLLYADVPDRARGFTVYAPNGLSIVDLGTRFTVEISDAGTQVDTLEGVVQLARRGQLLATLSTGQAMVYRDGELTELAGIRGPLVRQVHYGFAPGDLMGWQLYRGGERVSIDSTYVARLEAIDGRLTYGDGKRPMPPSAGDGLIGSMPFEIRDEHHPALVLRSPAFILEPGGGITLKLLGGTGGANQPPQRDDMLPHASKPDGFMGVALRRASDGRYLAWLKRAEPDEGAGNWQTLRLEPEALAESGAANEVLTLDLIDVYEGDWGWIAMDEIVIDGRMVVEPVP